MTPFDLQEYLIQMPFVSSSSPTSSQASRELVAELIAPAPHRFLAEQYAAGGHQFFHIAKAHTKSKIQPHAVRDDLLRKSMATVGAVRHSSSIPSLVPIHEGCDVFCQEKELVSKLEGKLGDDHKVTEFESGSNDLFAECCHIVLVGVADLFDKPMSP
jgi:hypothetical protein